MSFDDIVGTEGLSPEEEDTLRRVHRLLVAAGPPPELSSDLSLPPVPNAEADPPEVAYLFRRRRGRVLVLALAAALAAFLGGYAFGHSKGKPAAFSATRIVSMHGTSGTASHGVIRIADKDSVGNWPMQFEVSGLPQQPDRAAYYELWLTRNGKAVAPCGSFRVNAKTTHVRLSVSYPLKSFDGWVVTSQPAGHRDGLGPVVLTT
jgi:anti-sigma-K factor RskA